MLSVSIPSAMESNLSVIEVAAQKSKPGVKTPSRANDERVDDATQRGGEANADATTVGDEAVSRAMDVEKSPFEVEGEA